MKNMILFGVWVGSDEQQSIGEQTSNGPVLDSGLAETVQGRKRSWFSRNVPEEKLQARKYFDIEERRVDAVQCVALKFFN